jgi:hypothetical protein
MPTIATNTYRLPIAEKLQRGQTIIELSTGNPNVPGNEAALAAFASVQGELAAAHAAYIAATQHAQMLLTVRDNLVAKWNTALNGLAGVTECATGGEPEDILSAGFDVRSRKSPPHPVAQIFGVAVRYTGTPGYSDVTWQRDPAADAYRVQWSAEDITADGWREVGVVTEASFTGNGATPGQRCWYRVAGVNRLGQGPWSEPALRPVM